MRSNKYFIAGKCVSRFDYFREHFTPKKENVERVLVKIYSYNCTLFFSFAIYIKIQQQLSAHHSSCHLSTLL